MPTSDGNNITPIIDFIIRLRPLPRTILDLGIGFGKYGALTREYLDIGQERISPDKWTTNIVGIEGFSGYSSSPLWNCYSDIRIEDFTRHYEDYKGYDLVLMVDSLEHVNKPDGERILDYIRENNKHTIISCPDGDYPQGAVNGNEFERHRAYWTVDDFTIRGGRIIHRTVCTIAVFRGR